MESNTTVPLLTVLLVIGIAVNIVIAVLVYDYRAAVGDLALQERGEISLEFSEIKTIEEKGCPWAVAGNNDSGFTIQYFHSDFCGWCKKQEGILDELLKEKGDLFSLEFFNIRDCETEFIDAGATRVPTFVFGVAGFEEITHSSFVYKTDLEDLICKAHGGCLEP